MSEDSILSIIISRLLITIVIIVVSTVPFYLWVRWDCDQLEKNIGRETQYKFIGGGCLIRNNDGTLVPQHNWRQL